MKARLIIVDPLKGLLFFDDFGTVKGSGGQRLGGKGQR